MRLLLLAGTLEARQLAARLARMPDIAVTASLAGVTRAPMALSVATRSGGFGGEDEQVKYIEHNGITAVVDATHPFAQHISARTWTICQRLSIPYLQLLRPAWVPGPCDTWVNVAKPAAAVAVIAPGSTVFLATGRQTLSAFAGLANCHLLCRVVDPPGTAFPFDNGAYLVGRPPFTVEDEMALFRRHKIDWLVAKNAGGARGRSKLEAAQRLAIPVVMIARPDQPPGDKAATVEDALGWIRRQT